MAFAPTHGQELLALHPVAGQFVLTGREPLEKPRAPELGLRIPIPHYSQSMGAAGSRLRTTLGLIAIVPKWDQLYAWIMICVRWVIRRAAKKLTIHLSC